MAVGRPAVGEEGAGGGGEAGGGRGRSRQRWAAPSMERRSGSSGEEKWGKERERVHLSEKWGKERERVHLSEGAGRLV